MLEFIECWDHKNNLFYSIYDQYADREVGEIWKGNTWTLFTPDFCGSSRYSQRDLKQILDKLVELNGEH